MRSALQARPLAELAAFAGGGTPSKKRPEFYTGTIPWVTPKDMKCWEITDAQDHITEAAVKGSAARLIDPEAVLVVIRSGVLKHSLPIGINRVPVAINQDMKALRPKAGVDTDYLARAVSWAAPRILQTVRGTTADNVPLDVLKQLEVPLPPLPEQRRIAAILDKADGIRRKRAESTRLLDDFLRSAFLDMFGDPVTNPKGWPVRKLDEFVSQDRGVSYGVVQRGQHVEEGVPLIRISNILGNRASLDGVVRADRRIVAGYRRTELRGGELLLSIRGTVGRVAIAPEQCRGWNVTREIAVIPLTPQMNTRFAHCLLQTEGAQRFMTGEVRGVAQRGINLRDVRRLPVPVPPAVLCTEFSRVVEKSETARAHVHSMVSSSDGIFHSLVQRAFRGEL